MIPVFALHPVGYLLIYNYLLIFNLIEMAGSDGSSLVMSSISKQILSLEYQIHSNGLSDPWVSNRPSNPLISTLLVREIHR